MRPLKMSLTCLSLLAGILLSGNISLSQAANYIAPPPAYTIDLAHKTITIHPVGDVSTQVNQALTYLLKRPDQTALWTVQFDPGNYDLTQTFYADRLQNVALVSDINKPARLVKPPGYPCEYILVSRFSKNLTIKGFEFYGLTKVYKESNYSADLTNPVWKDQGIYLGSTNGVTVNMNRFYNFGNGALRISTAETDPVPGVNSNNSQVTQNYFNNVFQVTTTSNDTIHGGSANYLFQGNVFDNLRGSLKFASRTPGASNVYVRYNNIRSSSMDGMEIVGYTNMEISSNQFHNIARNTVNCYSNGRSVRGFSWGDNMVFKNNVVDNVAAGFRFSADPFGDGYQPAPYNVQVSGNTISNITGGNPAVILSNGTFPHLSVKDNKFSRIASKKYIMVQKPLTDMSITNNIAEGLPVNK